MKLATIPFSKSGHFSQLVGDYLAGKPELEHFYQYPPKLESFRKQVENRERFPCNRALLQASLQKQYGKLLDSNSDSSKLVSGNIELLVHPETFTVTTGHQLNLFTGPLYSIYKIASTIRLAQVLNKQQESYKVIPMFWMASEDHDLEEIKTVSIFGKEITWDTNASGAVGRMTTQGIGNMLITLKEILGEQYGDIKFFETAYLESDSLAEATRKIIHHLFGKYGLVIIDGDDFELKKSFLPEMEKELFSSLSSKHVNETSSQLQEKYKVQVMPRDINLFYLAAGKRDRIVKDHDDRFRVLNSDKTFTAGDMRKELLLQPGNFSPNVVLRPLYQEKILPNLAYIGGPGEISYWLQYKSMFEAFDVSFPVLLLRNSFLILEKNVYSRIRKLNLDTGILFDDAEQLISQVIMPEFAGLEDIKNEIEKLYNGLSDSADPGLLPVIESEKKKALNGISSIEEKMKRAIKKKNETVVSQVRSLKDKLFPGGQLQERHDNFIPYYLSIGPVFIDDIINHAAPLSDQFMILYDDSLMLEKA